MDKVGISPALEKIQQLFSTHGPSRQREAGSAHHRPDLSIITNFIRENALALDETAVLQPQNQAGNRTANSYKIATERFLKILGRLTQANEGLSRQERIFVNQYWSDLQHTASGK
ncbi:MAG: hypothetical protein J7619_29805 [Dyadobacter sp.]|uniref:hypothetical protein n=1 Tax=Dyadobacter sp. TaxID=1914288 RepID=UPI001B21AEF3|nr:hypothetical protein [Dyadobacter sp.]MBO9616919.1 hypothetical protein [Dyadobacter sp.]